MQSKLEVFGNKKQAGGEATVQQGRQDSENSDSSQKKYYEEEERKANKISLKLLSKEKLQGTDIMTFRLSRGGMDYTAGQYAFFELDGVSGDSKDLSGIFPLHLLQLSRIY